MKLDVKSILKEIDEKISNSDFWEKQEAENERNRWKNEDRFNNFLKFLMELAEERKSVVSDMYDYKQDELKEYDVEEFRVLFESLEHAVDTYARENFIVDSYGVDEDSYFTESSVVLKVKDNFYLIELIVGQGSFISFGKIDDFKPSKSNYVDYDLMIENIRNPHYKDTMKELIHEDLDDLKDRVSEYELGESIFIEALQEYVKNINS